VSLLSLTIVPELMVLAVVMVTTRSFAYGVTVPAREVLFTVVTPEEKYQAKSFIDTVVVRGGDTISMQIIGLLQGFGVSAIAMNLAALPIAMTWGVLAWGLGKRQSALATASLKRL
ncbi:MAG: MFS transporter, partial [Rubripirellula sp.]